MDEHDPQQEATSLKQIEATKNMIAEIRARSNQIEEENARMREEMVG